MLVYYFYGYYIFDFMRGDKTFNGTLGNITSSPLNTIAHGYNAAANKFREQNKSFEKPIPDNKSGYGYDKTLFSRYGGKSKKLRKSLRKSRKTRRKSNNKRSTKRSRK